MSGVRFRLLPAVPGHSAFAELNVRTYVRHAGRPGVWFFSLDAADPLAVRVARRWFHLNYFDARMDVRRERGTLLYESRRTHRGAPGADFRALYQPTGDALRAPADSLDRWLTARYCLYTVDGQGKLWRGEIDHAPWPLHPAEADLRVNTMTSGIGIALPKAAALLHYTPRLEVALWSLDRVS